MDLLLKKEHSKSELTFNGEPLRLEVATQEQLSELAKDKIWHYLFENLPNEPKKNKEK